ncbi:hypothetical protein A4A49_07821 [Nicotiana attenuata]|uniref:Uncharacterized protein n=1 Tax=Nicotiana attenuata TaxID=49451 RepID=A0A314L1D2_NICAT|nr:hypothetical protein A4A49_07821 [Nicotiana attenuata]
MTSSSFISLYNIASLLTLFFFLLLTVMAEDGQIQPNSLQVNYHSSADHYAIKKKLREDQITSNTVQYSPIMGRRGKHEYPKVHQSPSYLWRDKSLNASAHEVPSGPNPISNR